MPSCQRLGGLQLNLHEAQGLNAFLWLGEGAQHV